MSDTGLMIQSERTSGAVLTPVAATPARLLEIAVERGADLAQLEKLMDLQERWEANEARKAYVAALSGFKSNPPRIGKNKHVSFTTSKGQTEYWHATLDNVVNTVSPALSVHGLAFQWFTVQAEGGQIGVRCVLRHIQGHAEELSLFGPRDESGGKNSIQGVGSTVSYLQRYTLLSILGLASEDQDDDGKSAVVEMLSAEQAAEVKGLLAETNSDVAAFLKAMGGFESVDAMPAASYERAVRALNRKKGGGNGRK